MDAIQQYLAEGAVDPRHIENALHSLDQKTPKKIGTIRRIGSNIERLQGFLDMLDDIDFKNANPEASRKPGSMKINGVEIGVRPEIVLRGQGPRNKQLMGALKLQMSASTNFNKEAAGYVSAVVQEYCRRFLARGNEIVHAPYCQVIDVGNAIVHPGVKATARRIKDVEAECQNIAALWSSI